MRGWAIFVMVWVHSTWLALGADKVYMWSFAVVYPMPVFFAVSGYLWSYKNRPGVPWRRWLKMLVLLLVGSLGYALLFGEDAWGMFSDMYYYWFFAALLLCELCQYGLDRLALGRTARAALQVYIVGAVLLWNVFWWCMEDLGANRFGIPWADMESYWLFYAMGSMMGRDLKARRALTTWPVAAIGALLLAYGIYCGKGAGSPAVSARLRSPGGRSDNSRFGRTGVRPCSRGWGGRAWGCSCCRIRCCRGCCRWGCECPAAGSILLRVNGSRPWRWPSRSRC